MGMRKELKYIFVFAPLALIVALNVNAAGFLEESEHYISKTRLVEHGKTVETSQQEFRLGIFPHVANSGTQVSLKVGNPSGMMQQKLPAGYYFASPVYYYDARQVIIASPYVLPKNKAAFTAQHDPEAKSPELFAWDKQHSLWKRMPSSALKNKPWLAASTDDSSGVVAVLSQTKTESVKNSPPAQHALNDDKPKDDAQKSRPSTSSGTNLRTPTTNIPSLIILNDEKTVATKNADEVRPIASLTKLMTAMVLLDESLDFEKISTYSREKHYAFRNYMKFKDGEQVQAKDLWFSMLVGSMNVPTRMLVDSTGLTENEFITKMNTKASILGLENTVFYNTTGLSADLVPGQTKENVSTARETAQLLKEALKYPRIADALGKPFYKFEEKLDKDNKKEHKFAHTNKLLQRALPYRIAATKTGYTQEAGACFATLTKSRAGEFLVVSLGDEQYYQRFEGHLELLDWTLLQKS